MDFPRGRIGTLWPLITEAQNFRKLAHEIRVIPELSKDGINGRVLTGEYLGETEAASMINLAAKSSVSFAESGFGANPPRTKRAQHSRVLREYASCRKRCLVPG
jgi:hypothetical protein